MTEQTNTTEQINTTQPSSQNVRKPSPYLISFSIIIAGVLIAGALLYVEGKKESGGESGNAAVSSNTAGSNAPSVDTSALEASVLPKAGVEIPALWGDMGAQMVSAGVIDKDAFATLYQSRGGITADEEQLLAGTNNGNLKITPENSGLILNLLWALGLGNKNPILEEGPMSDPQYGGAGGFASTGGWSLAKGGPMEHYSKHQFVALTKDQQERVESVAKGIFRPCCNNDTFFPDCNHGMAMLGLLELMASQNVSEADMYKAALSVNAYWFPDTYLTIAKYFAEKGIAWEEVDPRQALGVDFSSGSGYRQVLSQVTPPERKGGGGGCGV